MTLLLGYSLRNLSRRKITTILTAGGMALVSFIFAAVLMLAEGLEKTLIETGSPENVTALRGSAESEISSVISRNEAAIVESQPEIQRDADGAAIAAKEIVILVTLPKRETGSPTNVVIRGVEKDSFRLRPGVRITAGRRFRPGSHEIVAGAGIARRIADAEMGGRLRFALTDWRVTGIMEAGGSAFDSEVWADAEPLMAAFRRADFSVVTARVPSDAAFQTFKERLEGDPRLSLDVKRERDFYAEQSEIMAKFIRIMGTAMTVFFSVGAILGAMVTMYAAVSNRTREIGALRALGFGKRTILTTFLLESLFLGLLGGLIGVGCSSLLQWITVSTVNWGTFSELAFTFRLTPSIAAYALAAAALMGAVGGAAPAWRASRLRIVDALRAH